MNNVRWSDQDRFLGPFTIAGSGYSPFGFMLTSADDEDRRASMRVHLGKTTILAPVPNWLIRPRKTKVIAKYWSEADIARMGRDWYWQIDEREFGFCLSDGALHVHYGVQTNEWPGSKSRCFFYPWRSWRVERKTLYDADGKRFADLPLKDWESRFAIQDTCPTVRFLFRDFDGEEITAITRIEETEQKWGEGRWKWLSLFRRPRVTRGLDIRFLSEVGKRKGSWKGGTVGHGITMLPGETHEDAFRRYCPANGLVFIKRQHLQ
jgi:hypothetical protein